MNLIATVFACGLATLLLLMSTQGLLFLRSYWRHESQRLTGPLPKADIIMPLRGPDPFLRRCLIALTQQNYPDYFVHIIVDHKEDPVRQLVEEVIQETGTTRIKLEELNDFSETCGLKLSAMRQAIRNLAPDREVFVMVDADANPNADWLSDLMAGMSDPSVGVACGIRWYSVKEKTLANLTRHVWNGGAVLQMAFMNVGWGGAIAYRREAFEKADVYSQWGKTLFDDTFATDRILKCGYRLQVLPRVTMVNEETTDMKSCLSFIARQVLSVRLYHSSWRWIMASCILTAAWTVGAIVTLLAAIVIQSWTAALIVGGGLAVYFLGQAIQMSIAELIINRSQVRQGKPEIEFSTWRLPVVVPCVLMVYPLAMLRACRAQSVTWRGITYEFKGPLDVKRLNYEPFRPVGPNSTKSL